MSIQDIRRPIVYLAGQQRDSELRLSDLEQAYRQLAASFLLVHNQILNLTAAVAALAASTVVTLPAPRDTATYSPLVIPDWNTTVFLTAISTTTFTITYGTAAPGGGGNLRCVIVG